MPATFRHAELSNGLTIVAEDDPAAHTAAIGFFVKTGARDEDPPVMGVSHFLEHMMFKGTATRSAEDVDREFDALGADHNAFTTSEMTAFYAHCLPEGLPQAEAIVADILRPALRQSDFDDEKTVILEEIAMYRDQPFWVLYEQALEHFYGPHPLSHRVLGTEETIEAMTLEQMRAYFDHRYSADNTTVALAGNVGFDRIVDRLAEHCGSWPTTGVARAPQALGRESFTLGSPTASQHYLVMLSRGPALSDPRRYAASILTHVLGEPEGSRLYWALIETGLADEAHAQFTGRDGCGEMIVYCACGPDRAEAVEATIRREIEGLVDSLTADDLERVRSKIATNLTLRGELPAGRMRRLGQVWTYLGEYTTLEEELDRINAVTLDGLRAVAEAFPLDAPLTGRLVPS